jgi:hypothetical protein
MVEHLLSKCKAMSLDASTTPSLLKKKMTTVMFHFLFVGTEV